MRVLHTGDWHLGKKLFGHSRLEEQTLVLGRIQELVEQRNVDLLIVAGDVFDRSVPPVEALELFGSFLEAMADADCAVVAIAGNHDGASRLGFGARFFQSSNLFLRTDPADFLTPIVLGQDSEKVEFYALPYAEPEAAWQACVRRGLLEESEKRFREHVDVVRNLVPKLPPRSESDCARVFVGHLFCVGGVETPESERPVSAGGVGHVPPTLLDDFDYVALGHLHRPQQVAGRSHIRYSGSPLKYSVSEHTHQKSVALIDVAVGDVSVELVPIDVGRDLVVLEDSFEALRTSVEYEKHRDDYVAAYYTDSTYVLHAAERLGERFSFLLQTLAKRVVLQAMDQAERTSADSPDALLSSFWEYARVGHELEESHLAAFRSALARAAALDGEAGGA